VCHHAKNTVGVCRIISLALLSAVIAPESHNQAELHLTVMILAIFADKLTTLKL
jgi:hypothetical protein